jgi:hypothetical protein
VQRKSDPDLVIDLAVFGEGLLLEMRGLFEGALGKSHIGHCAERVGLTFLDSGPPEYP